MVDYTLKGKLWQNWVEALCVANFDHELGLMLEDTFPPSALLKQEAKSVAMLSFPESNCADGDWEHTFFYRFRRGPCSAPLSLEQPENDEYLFGFAHYVQRKDPTLPRGCRQKAFVVVTRYYFAGFYARLAQLFGRAYFSGEGKLTLQVRTAVADLRVANIRKHYDVAIAASRHGLRIPHS